MLVESSSTRTSHLPPLLLSGLITPPSQRVAPREKRSLDFMVQWAPPTQVLLSPLKHDGDLFKSCEQEGEKTHKPDLEQLHVF